MNLKENIPILRQENQTDTDSANMRRMDEERPNGRMRLEKIRKNKEDAIKGEYSQAQLSENNRVWADFIGERKRKAAECKDR